MKPTRIILTALLAVALLAGCAPRGYDTNASPSYHATCTDRYGRVLPDWQCDKHSYGARWSYESYTTYQRNLRTPGYYSIGRKCTCGTTVQPKGANGKPVGVQYADKKTVTVYKNGKQVGNPVKLSQDANKVNQTSRQVGTESKRDSARKPSWGSYTKKSSSTNRSSSTTRRK